MRKLPPFGKPLALFLDTGGRLENDINLFFGHKAWEKGKSFSQMYPCRTLTLPPWDHPCHYFWPVKNCDVLIFESGYADESYITDLAGALFEHSANIVRCVTSQYELIKFDK